jgi:hypothetical protein
MALSRGNPERNKPFPCPLSSCCHGGHPHPVIASVAWQSRAPRRWLYYKIECLSAGLKSVIQSPSRLCSVAGKPKPKQRRQCRASSCCDNSHPHPVIASEALIIERIVSLTVSPKITLRLPLYNTTRASFQAWRSNADLGVSLFWV